MLRAKAVWCFLRTCIGCLSCRGLELAHAVVLRSSGCLLSLLLLDLLSELLFDGGR